MSLESSPPSKRQKHAEADPKEIRQRRSTFLSTLSRPVTPPSNGLETPRELLDQGEKASGCAHEPRCLRSPFQLTHIRDLPASHNVDAVRVTDILNDPMIKECWQFNYLFDVDWLMGQFDSDVRDIVQIRIVHGSWKREAPNKIGIDGACQRYKNVKATTAYLPDPFGTHHSKMMVLLRHDDMAQVVIHTANMIPQDWTNMSQAVWRSPLLPLANGAPEEGREPSTLAPGSGHRFKHDLLAYLKAYRDQWGNLKLKDLINQVRLYDFSTIRASLVASVPSKVHLQSTGPDEPLWGWPALRRILRDIPCSQPRDQEEPSHIKSDDDKASPAPQIVIQVSSVATLGKDEKYLKETLFSALSSTAPDHTDSGAKPLSISKPKFSIIFPTAATIRESLDGYASGASIHMKIQSPAQQRQLQTLRRYLCQWSRPQGNTTYVNSQNVSAAPKTCQALRQRAAPHIKTYVRFTDSEKMDRIDWAMMTSANLSTQAWGSAMSSSGEVKIQSYEIGVLVWPNMFAENESDGAEGGKGKVYMIPTFGKDIPGESSVDSCVDQWIGFRMPYDLPLIRYSDDDVPWCATTNHMTLDWRGGVWSGYEER